VVRAIIPVLLMTFAFQYTSVASGSEIDTALTNKGWISLSSNHAGKKPVSYLTEAIFGVDIALPEVTNLTGKVKFLEGIKGVNNSTNLGYLVEINVAPLDLSKVPQKYKEEKKEIINGEETIKLPIDQVVYEINFQFMLRDSDGFILKEIESKTHPISSGELNRIQEVAPESIAATIANRTRSVSFNMTVRKCLTCQ
jgi:hypothetical protein